MSKVRTQATDNLFNYSIVIVDNDQAESARPIVEWFKKKTRMSITYRVESEQNIALARNKALANADGEYVALIDDDEFPDPQWLLLHYRALHKFGADGVLGPVRPFFENEPPAWVIKGRFCERKEFKTGEVLKKPQDTRTGNVLMKKEIFANEKMIFNPIYGKVGGEDVDYFKRMIEKGRTFIWCNEASVNEVVPANRLKRSYFLKRALLRGEANAKRQSFFSYDVIKSILAVMIYAPIITFLLWRQDLYMKYLIKCCDHLGKVLAVSGLKISNDRPT